jgi:hypothetical protein
MIAPVIAGMIFGGAAGYWAGLIYDSALWGIVLGLLGGWLSGLLWTRTFLYGVQHRTDAEKNPGDLGGKIGVLVGWLCTAVLHVGLFAASGNAEKEIVIVAMLVGILAGGLAGGCVGVFYAPWHTPRIREMAMSQLAPPLPPDVSVSWPSGPLARAAILVIAWDTTLGFSLGRIAFLDKATLFDRFHAEAWPVELVGAAAGLVVGVLMLALVLRLARRGIRKGGLESWWLEVQGLLLAAATVLLGGAIAFGADLRIRGWWNADAFIVCLGWTLAGALCTGIVCGTAAQWFAEATARHLAEALAAPAAPTAPLGEGLAEDRAS